MVNILKFKEFLQLNRKNKKETNTPIKKWTKDFNRHFSKENIKWPAGY